MSDKAVLRQFKVLRTAMEGLEKALQSSTETPKAAPKKTAKAVKAKAASAEKKASKAPATLKEQAQAALDAKKFHHKSKEAATLKAFVTSKADLRKAAGREMSANVAEILGLPPPKKPGPAPKAKAKAAPKAAKAAPKTEKKPGPKPKAAKATSQAPAAGLKAQAQAALDTKKFHHKSKEAATLKAFIESKVDGRSQEGRSAAIEVCTILGLPPPKKPGPAPKAGAKAAAKAPKAAPKKGKTSGKGQADAASDAPKPSSTKSTGAKPRAIEAVEAVLTGSMNAAEIIKALEEKDWVPASNDPKTYVSFILSQNKEKFERDPDKGRGYYRLAKGGTKSPVKANGTTNGTNGTTASKKEEAPAPAPAPVVAAPPEPEEEAPSSEPLPTATEEENPFDDSLDESVLS